MNEIYEKSFPPLGSVEGPSEAVGGQLSPGIWVLPKSWLNDPNGVFFPESGPSKQGTLEVFGMSNDLPNLPEEQETEIQEGSSEMEASVIAASAASSKDEEINFDDLPELPHDTSLDSIQSTSGGQEEEEPPMKEESATATPPLPSETYFPSDMSDKGSEENEEDLWSESSEKKEKKELEATPFEVKVSNANRFNLLREEPEKKEDDIESDEQDEEEGEEEEDKEEATEGDNPSMKAEEIRAAPVLLEDTRQNSPLGPLPGQYTKEEMCNIRSKMEGVPFLVPNGCEILVEKGEVRKWPQNEAEELSTVLNRGPERFPADFLRVVGMWSTLREGASEGLLEEVDSFIRGCTTTLDWTGPCPFDRLLPAPRSPSVASASSSDWEYGPSQRHRESPVQSSSVSKPAPKWTGSSNAPVDQDEPSPSNHYEQPQDFINQSPPGLRSSTPSQAAPAKRQWTEHSVFDDMPCRQVEPERQKTVDQEESSRNRASPSARSCASSFPNAAAPTWIPNRSVVETMPSLKEEQQKYLDKSPDFNQPPPGYPHKMPSPSVSYGGVFAVNGNPNFIVTVPVGPGFSGQSEPDSPAPSDPGMDNRVSLHYAGGMARCNPAIAERIAAAQRQKFPVPPPNTSVPPPRTFGRQIRTPQLSAEELKNQLLTRMCKRN